MKQTKLDLLAFAWLLLVGTVIYAPYFGNQLIFDDTAMFAGPIFDAAQNPFLPVPRSFPLFTLGFVQVTTSSLAANRAVSLLLHVCCAFLMYRLASQLLLSWAESRHASTSSSQSEISRNRANFAALAVTSLFVAHPVAAYGVGYIAQRTILFATLFSLSSLLYLNAAIRTGSYPRALIAAGFYGAAAYSKEHAILLPFASILLFASMPGGRNAWRQMALYGLICLPLAYSVYLARESIVGIAYEPDAAGIMSQIAKSDTTTDASVSPWIRSFVLQLGLFFKYLRLWLWPDLQSISIDIRVPIPHGLPMSWALPRILAAIAFALTTLWMAFRAQSRLRLIGAGLLFFGAIFGVEFATIRFQEPIVLYRSYLWAIGLALSVAAVLHALPTRWLAISTVAATVGLGFMAQDRLASMATNGRVWMDAAEKLNAPDLPGAARIYYNRGEEYVRTQQFDAAISDFNRAISASAPNAVLHLQRGNAYYKINKLELALRDFDAAVELEPKNGSAHFARGVTLERIGSLGEARKAIEISNALGYLFAKSKLEKMQKGN